MSESTVYIDSFGEYDTGRLVRDLTDSICELEVQIPGGTKVLIKPNVLGAYAPERHITTHPAVIEAVVRVLLDNGNKVVIADSSSIPGGTGRALQKSGIASLGETFDDVTVFPLEGLETRDYSNDGNYYLKKVNLPRFLDDVACMVNVPKLKSHSLTKLTGAVKNLLGCIPGGGKQQAHVIAPSTEEFSHLLVDLYGFLKPKIALNVMDGIVGIDGLGPGPTGRRNQAELFAVSADAVALDMACTRAVRSDPRSVATSRFAVDRGLANAEFDTTREIEPIRFRLPFTIPFQPVLAFLFKHVSGLQRRKPAVIEDKCEQCGICVKVCPVRCITMDGYPKWDYDRCIFCYCCHESCPYAAIKLKASLSFICG